MKCLVILNHNLTLDQKEDLRQNHGADMIVEMNPDQKKIWGSIPSTGSKWVVLEHIQTILSDICEYDLVVCQGEFTAFSLVLDECADEIPCLVACSERETVETQNPDGSITKTAVFRHVQFRSVNAAPTRFYRLFGQCQDCGGSSTSRTFRTINEADEEFKNPSDTVDWYALENEKGGKIPLPQWCQFVADWCPDPNPSAERCSECKG